MDHKLGYIALMELAMAGHRVVIVKGRPVVRPSFNLPREQHLLDKARDAKPFIVACLTRPDPPEAFGPNASTLSRALEVEGDRLDSLEILLRKQPDSKELRQEVDDSLRMWQHLLACYEWFMDYGETLRAHDPEAYEVWMKAETLEVQGEVVEQQQILASMPTGDDDGVRYTAA